jgi:hypothetical protein
MSVVAQSKEQAPVPPGEVTAENVEAVLAAAGCHHPNFPDTRGKREFIEALAAESESYDPREAMTAALDGERLGDLKGDFTGLSENEVDGLKRIVRGVFEFCVGDLFVDQHGRTKVKQTDPNARITGGAGVKIERRLSRRFLALAWLIDPAMFTGRPLSLTAIAKQLEASVCKFSPHITVARKKFRIENQFLNHSRHRRKSNPEKAGSNEFTTNQNN